MEYSELEQTFVEVSKALAEIVHTQRTGMTAVEAAQGARAGIVARYHVEATEQTKLKCREDRKSYALAKATEDADYSALGQKAQAPPWSVTLAVKRAELKAKQEILWLRLGREEARSCWYPAVDLEEKYPDFSIG